jgi:hypothetical protein
MIEDLIDFIEIHPIVAFEAIYEPMLTSCWSLISCVVQLYIIMQYKGQHPTLLPKMPFCFCISRQNLCVFIKISCIVYTQTWIQVFLETWMQNLYRVYQALRRKTGWLGTECGDNMSTRGLLSRFTSTIYSSSIKQILSSFH